jgi:hypothetical protein
VEFALFSSSNKFIGIFFKTLNFSQRALLPGRQPEVKAAEQVICSDGRFVSNQANQHETSPQTPGAESLVRVKTS